jgi:phenylpropionate dioxygenase-like ring-hydroxylating dioxygenase large terminal subunit
MLTKEENQLVTDVGAGTPLGEVMRRYWLPACLSAEIAQPDGPPIRVKLLGEELVAFRNSDGKVGLLEEYCPHRLASMFLGRNEENGLRCVYHGWKFDIDGHCTDMPNEPAASRFKEKVFMKSYPTLERGGVVWAYLGPREKMPEPPAMEWLRAPATHRNVSVTREFCNYLQAIEGGIDTVHSSFLHNNNLSDLAHFKRVDQAPRLEVERTAYGFRYAGIRDIGDKGQYLRIYQFVLPFHQFRSAQVDYDEGRGSRKSLPQIRGHMWVPMDNDNTLVFNWIFAIEEDKPLTEDYIRKYEAGAGRGPDGETRTRHRIRANDWLIDREVQRDKTFTGIQGVNTQDLAVQESMGRIVDRSREHLGTTDKAIIELRRLLLDSIADLKKGAEPRGLDATAYRDIRAGDVVVPRGARWQEAAEKLLAARW